MKREEGSALVLSFITILILLALIAGIGVMINNEVHIARYEENKTKAFYMAEAGIEFAQIIIDDDTFWDEDGNLIENVLNNVSNLLDGGELFKLTMTKNENEITLDSIGSYNNVSRTLQIIYESEYSNAINQLVGSGGKMEFGNNAIINDGDLYTNNEIEFGNNAHINNGDLYSSIIDFGNNEILNNSEIKEPDMSSPYSNYEEIQSYANNIIDSEIDETITHIEDNYTIKNNQTMNGNGILLIDGDLNIKNNVKINQSKNNFLVVIVRGNVTVGNNFYFHGLLFAEEDIDINNNAEIEGIAYAAGNITTGNNLHFNGLLLAENDIDIKNNVEIEGAVNTNGSATFGNNAHIDLDNSYIETLNDMGIEKPGGEESGEISLNLISWQEE